MGFLSSHIDNNGAFVKIDARREGAAKLIVQKAQKIGWLSSSDNRACGDYSGSVGRSRKYKIYVTSGGNLVVTREDDSQWQGERTRYYAYVAKNVEDIKKWDFDCDSWLEKDLIDFICETFELDIGEVVE